MNQRAMAAVLSAIALAFAVGMAVSSAAAQQSVKGAAQLANGESLMLDSHCPSNYACFWTGDAFGGSKNLRGAEWAGTGWHPFDNDKRSAKNSFDNKIVCYKNQNGLRGWIRPSYSVSHQTLTQFKILRNGQGTSNCDGL